MRLPYRYLLRLATAAVLGEEKRRGERGARGYAEAAGSKEEDETTLTRKWSFSSPL